MGVSAKLFNRALINIKAAWYIKEKYSFKDLKTFVCLILTFLMLFVLCSHLPPLLLQSPHSLLSPLFSHYNYKYL